MKHYKVIKAFLNHGIGDEIQVSDQALAIHNEWGKWKDCLELIPDPAPAKAKANS